MIPAPTSTTSVLVRCLTPLRPSLQAIRSSDGPSPCGGCTGSQVIPPHPDVYGRVSQRTHVKVSVVTAAQAEWADDVLPGYQQTTLALGADPDGEGDLFATLVRRADRRPAPVTPCWRCTASPTTSSTPSSPTTSPAAGSRFYALDLHKCGRSWRDGQTPHFTTDLARYDRELERALAVIAAENPGVVGAGVRALRGRADRVAVAGPGAPARRDRGAAVWRAWCSTVPWFDLHGPAILRTRLTSTAIGAMSRVRKTRVVRGTGKGGYGLTLHRDYHGEFDYNLQWKPLGGFPVTFGWIHAVRRGQATLHRGLDVGVPNLILRSDHSVPETDGPGHRCSAATPCSTSPRSPAGRAASATARPSCRSPTPSTTCSCRWPSRGPAAYRELAGWLDSYVEHLDKHRRHRPVTDKGDAWSTSTSRSSEPVRATRFSTSATPTRRSRSASRASSAAPASTSAASRPRCSSTPPRSPRPCGRRRRFGVDAHIDGVRWSDIVSRVFGRIDPLAHGRRALPAVLAERHGVRQPHPVRRAAPTAATGCAPTTATSSPPTRSSSPPGRGRWCPRRSPAAVSISTPATRSCASLNCPSIW